MVQPQQRRHGSDRRGQTESHCTQEQPSATRRNNGSRSYVNTANHATQSYDEKHGGQPNLYTHTGQVYSTDSDESIGFSFSTESDAQTAHMEAALTDVCNDAQTAYTEDARMMRNNNPQTRWNAQTAFRTTRKDSLKTMTSVIVPDRKRQEKTVCTGWTENGWKPSVDDDDNAQTAYNSAQHDKQHKTCVVVPDETRRKMTVRTGRTGNGRIPSVEEEVEGMEFAFTSDLLPSSKATNQNSPDMAMVDTVVTTTRQKIVKSGGPEQSSSEGHAESKEPASPGHVESKELTSPGPEQSSSEGHAESKELASPGSPERVETSSEGHDEAKTDLSSPDKTQTALVSTDHESNSHLNMTMVVDSGASSHYVDDKLIKGIRKHMFEYKTLKEPSIITTAGMHRLHGSATGKLRVNVTDHLGEKKTVTLPVTIVSGIGRNLFSSVTGVQDNYIRKFSDREQHLQISIT